MVYIDGHAAGVKASLQGLREIFLSLKTAEKAIRVKTVSAVPLHGLLCSSLLTTGEIMQILQGQAKASWITL